MRQTLWSIVFPLALVGLVAHGVLGYRLDTIEDHLRRARAQIVTDVAGTALKAQARSVAGTAQHHRDNWEWRAKRVVRDMDLIRQVQVAASDRGAEEGGSTLRDTAERLRKEVDEAGDVITLTVYDPSGNVLARSPEWDAALASAGTGAGAEETHPDLDDRRAPGSGGGDDPAIEVHPDGTITARSPIEEMRTGRRLGWIEVRCGPGAVHRPIQQAALFLGDRGHAHLWVPEARRAIVSAPVVAEGDPGQAKRAQRISNDIRKLEDEAERPEGIMLSGEHVLAWARLDDDPQGEPGGAPWTVLLYRDAEEIMLTVSSLRAIRDSLEDWRRLLYGGLAGIAVVSLILARITRVAPGSGRRSPDTP